MTNEVEKSQRRGEVPSTESGGETIVVKLADGGFYGPGTTGTLV